MQERKIIQSANSWKDLNKTLESFTKSNRTKFAGDIFEYLTSLSVSCRYEQYQN